MIISGVKLSNTVVYDASFNSTGALLYLDPGNTARYPGSGTTWTDLSGNNNTATLVGSPTWTSAQPTSTSFTATNAGGGGFNQLRLFSRAGGSEVQTADIGMIRVYNGVVTLAQVQSQYAAFKARFGY